LKAAEGAASEGAEVVIPSIGVLMTLLGEERVHSIHDGVPILNGVTALVKSAEAVVRMRALMGGHWTSRRNRDVYPGVASPKTKGEKP
jgi:allantoin racemase